MKVVTAVGARPQFIKMAPVSAALRGRADEVVVHTGQHYDDGMSGVFFRELGIRDPEYHLGVGSGPHGAQTAAMLQKVEEVLLKERPDVLLVYGDTNSTLAAGLAAAKMHIPVAHVEAGPRTGDMRMPEEVNRILVDHLSRWLFAPTEHAAANLRAEGLQKGVHVVGDVMVDAMHQSMDRARAQSGILGHLGVPPGAYVLATIHRADNTAEAAKLKGIVEGLAATGHPVVLPLHPRTKQALQGFGILPFLERSAIHVLPPVGYLDMLMLEGSARAIVTDSGGVQKEAYLLGVPCVTVQETTGWPETVAAGWNRLVPPGKAAIADAVRTLSPDRSRPRDVFGPPGASAKTVDVLLRDVKA